MTDLQKLYRLNNLLWEKKRIEDHNRQIEKKYQEKLINSQPKIEMERLKKKREESISSHKKRISTISVAISLVLIIAAILLPLSSKGAVTENIYNYYKYQSDMVIQDLDKEVSMFYASASASAYLLGSVLIALISPFIICTTKTKGDYPIYISSLWIIVAVIAWVVGGVAFAAGQNNGALLWRIILGIIYPLIMLFLIIFRFSWIATAFPMFLFLLGSGFASAFLIRLVWKNAEKKIKNNISQSSRIRTIDDLYNQELRNYQALEKEYIAKKQREKLSVYEVEAAIDKDGTLHTSNKNLQTVGSLIWCIEHNYATGIVTAMNYLEQQRYNQAFQNQMRAMQAQLNQVQNTASQAQKAAQNAAYEAQNASYEASRAQDAAKKAQNAAEAPIEITIEERYL